MTGAYQFLKKYGVAISFGVGAILAVLTIALIVSGYPEFTPSREELYELGIFNFGLYATYFLIGLACALVLIFSLIYVIRNPKESIKGIIAFAVLAVLFAITYSMGDAILTEELINSDPSLLPTEEVEQNGVMITKPVVFAEGATTSSDLKLADGMIIYGYVMLILASVAMFIGMIRDIIKQ